MLQGTLTCSREPGLLSRRLFTTHKSFARFYSQRYSNQRRKGERLRSKVRLKTPVLIIRRIIILHKVQCCTFINLDRRLVIYIVALEPGHGKDRSCLWETLGRRSGVTEDRFYSGKRKRWKRSGSTKVKRQLKGTDRTDTGQ